MRIAPLRAAVVTTALSVGLLACQPVDAPPPREVATDPAAAPQAPGAPGTSGVPQGLDELQARLETVAREWQDEPALAEVEVELADATAWTQVRVTYVAPDADRLLFVDLGSEGMAQQRPTFATLGIEPISRWAVEQIPALPQGTQDPQGLAEAAQGALDGCGYATTVTSVLYASGAPLAWDGERWTEEIAWTATVATQDGDAVLVDPVSGALSGRGCLSG